MSLHPAQLRALSAPRPAVDRDRSLRPERGRYRLDYTLAGSPGTWLVQVVNTRVRYLRGDLTVVEYRGTYGEAFRLGAGGARDIHDFDLHRDGWGLAAIARLLRTRGGAADAALDRPARLECEKEYLLGPGQVEGATALVERSDGEAFAYLAEGPGAAARATIRLAGDPEDVVLEAPSPFPFDGEASGRGRFTGPAGWRARETFRYAFATLSGRLEDGGGYRAAPLPAPDALPDLERP